MIERIKLIFQKYAPFWAGIYVLTCLIGICAPHLSLLIFLAFIMGWYKTTWI
jgi:hypothetical protein